MASSVDIVSNLEGSPVVIWAQDKELRYLWVVNPTMGFKEKEVMGKTDHELLDARSAATIVDLKRKALETGREFREIVKIVRNDHEETHDLFVHPVADGQGQTFGISCVSMRVADETLTLVDEANHRIKNNLAIAQTLLRMQRREATDADARSALRNAEGQLESIARLHGKLASGGSHGRINVKDYMETVCTQLADTYSDGAFKVETDFADEEVEGPAALKLALIISELIMNAFKHNQASDHSLTVHLSYRDLGDYRQLIVEDDGEGLPTEFDPQGDAGVGMRIVRLISEEMGGTLKRGDNNSGACFVFEFPNS